MLILAQGFGGISDYHSKEVLAEYMVVKMPHI